MKLVTTDASSSIHDPFHLAEAPAEPEPWQVVVHPLRVNRPSLVARRGKSEQPGL